ncbi:hypothetical protein [Teredinibacter turnerae]|uniref:hypothetical protein n=1 Tax=Teredinibacter turnerae TaxID=2426 RepID=UPI000405427F|nr:hypothetical protein [Teredinibacter turnerae]
MLKNTFFVALVLIMVLTAYYFGALREMRGASGEAEDYPSSINLESAGKNTEVENGKNFHANNLNNTSPESASDATAKSSGQNVGESDYILIDDQIVDLELLSETTDNIDSIVVTDGALNFNAVGAILNSPYFSAVLDNMAASQTDAGTLALVYSYENYMLDHQFIDSGEVKLNNLACGSEACAVSIVSDNSEALEKYLDEVISSSSAPLMSTVGAIIENTEDSNFYYNAVFSKDATNNAIHVDY